MTRVEAAAKIKQLCDEARAALRSAAQLSDTFYIEFSWDFEYGLSGYYYPKRPISRAEALRLIETGATLTDQQRTQIANILRSNPVDEDDEWEESSAYEGWTSSSQMC